MALLKVLLLLGLGVSVNSDVSLQKRIIGGQNCHDTERLYHVRLESSKGNKVDRCGGSLIHSQWILTAAHCWKSEPGWTNRVILKVHPRTVIQYNPVIRQAPVIYDLGHDIMLLKLETPVTDVPVVRLPDCSYRLKNTPESGNQATSRTRTCLAQVRWTRDTCKGRRTHCGLEVDTPVDDVVQLAGEGATTTNYRRERFRISAIPAHLQCVDMKVVGASIVWLKYGRVFSAQALNQDMCFGDSGGAVVYNDMIYGVISFVTNNYAFLKPSYLIDVCAYLGWIKQKTGIQ